MKLESSMIKSSTMVFQHLKARHLMWELITRFQNEGVFDMDTFTALERHIDRMCGIYDGTYPNPCSEQLIAGSGLGMGVERN